MAKECHKKSKSILIKVSKEEKDAFTQKATEYGGTLSDLIRNRILNATIDSNGKQMQDIACLLCQLAGITNQVSDTQLRKKFIEVEEQLWQLIK